MIIVGTEPRFVFQKAIFSRFFIAQILFYGFVCVVCKYNTNVLFVDDKGP